jgi:nucleotide-binding universal stress UspA family protein
VSRFGRILVAFDGSDPARHALDAALDLALDLGARVEVLAVGGHLPRYAATVGEVDDALHERDVFFAGVLADAHVLAAERGLEITTTFNPGHPAEEIVRYGQASGADLIVVGHRGHFLHGFPLGSTAARVTRHAHCPVLVVR